MTIGLCLPRRRGARGPDYGRLPPVAAGVAPGRLRLRRRMQLHRDWQSRHLTDRSQTGSRSLAASRSRRFPQAGIFSARTRAEMEEMLASLGLRGRNALGYSSGSKISFFALGPVIGYVASQQLSLSSPMDRLVPAVAAVVGLLLPEMIVKRLRKGYLEKVERGVPDTLDMMVLCAQAGLGTRAGAGSRNGRDRSRTPGDRAGTEADRRRNAPLGRTSSRPVELRLAHEVGKRQARDDDPRSNDPVGTPLTESLRGSAAEMRR